MHMNDFLYLRSPRTTVAARSSDLLYLSPSHADFRCLHLRRNQSAVHRLLNILREPKSLDELVALTALPHVKLNRILSILVREEIIVYGPAEGMQSTLCPRRQNGPGLATCKRLVLGVSGSIYASQVISLTLLLKYSVAEAIDVILTKDALRFVKPEVFEYFGMRVWTDAFNIRQRARVPHIDLASQADIVMIVPATARTIHRLATGECSDLLSLVTAATDAPVLVVPVMNRRMFAFPPIKENLETLRAAGMYVTEPGLACEAGNDRGDLFFSGAGVRDETVTQLLAAILAMHGKGLEEPQLSGIRRHKVLPTPRHQCD